MPVLLLAEWYLRPSLKADLWLSQSVPEVKKPAVQLPLLLPLPLRLVPLTLLLVLLPLQLVPWR